MSRLRLLIGTIAGRAVCGSCVSAVVVAALCGLLGSAPAGAENPPPVVDQMRYQKIQLPWPTEADLRVIQSMPDLEPMQIEPGAWVRYLSRPELTERLIAAGLQATVLVEDLGAYYRSRQTLRAGFGDFYTYSEAVAAMDSIHAAWPSITTSKMSIGTTIEGRTIWAMKVSDNPTIDEDEPEVLFDALHHAREPITVSELLNFMRFLCQNYGTDPEATFLVNQREIWFVPTVNPDGYVYNETTNPDGGGMWRKNRRLISGGDCDGVDLNRNYGFQWVGSGSSTNPCDETYRGSSAWSEPEIQTMRDFIVSRHFVTSNSYHSVAGLILYPWGYTTTPPPDAATFAGIADQMNRDSGYTYGSAASVLYQVNGGAFDWAYGDTGMKPRIFAFTTEVGGSDFWPLESEIPGLLAENLYSDIYLSLVAGAYLNVTQVAVTGGDGNGRLDPGETANLVVTLKNEGVLASATGVTATLSSDDAYVQLVDATSSYADLGPGATGTNGSNPFQVSLDPTTPQGHEATFRMAITWSGQGATDKTITLTIGLPSTIYADDFETGNHGWTRDPTHTASTGEFILIDPNPTDWQPGDDTTPAPGVTAWITGQNSSVGVDDVDNGTSAIRSPTWNLAGRSHVRLSVNYFHGQRDAGGDSGDFFRIDLSNNGGTSFGANLVLFGDATHQATWTPLQVDLETKLPLTSQMVLRFQAADGTATGDIVEAGFDDLALLDMGSGNHAPTAPALAGPPSGSTVFTTMPMLRVDNATDADGDTLTYGFRVYSDALLTGLVRSVDGVAEGLGATAWKVTPGLSPGTYYWRAFAQDDLVRGPFMPSASFRVAAGADVATGAAEPVFAVAPAQPNPFVAQTTVRFTMPQGGPAWADVFDPQGRRVRALYRGFLPAGSQALTWDGRDESGAPVAPGMYFLLFQGAGRHETLKLTVVR